MGYGTGFVDGKESEDMEKIVIFEQTVEMKKEASYADMEQSLLKGDAHEVMWVDTWQEAKDYLNKHPGKYWIESGYASRIQRVQGTYAVECEIDEDNGEILSMGDMEFSELTKANA